MTAAARVKRKDVGAKYVRGKHGDCSKRLPRWREVTCAGCGDPLHVREDIPEPVLCDTCDASTTVDRVLESVARFKAGGSK